jgi:hypothetical protein
MTDQKLNELALQAWKQAMGDALTAVKLLRDWTDLGLREAVELIQKTATQVGGRCSLRLLSKEEAQELGLSWWIQRSHEEIKNDPHLAAHRAARGVRKVRGAK